METMLAVSSESAQIKCLWFAQIISARELSIIGAGSHSISACVVSLVDRLVHNAEVVAIEGESYRLKEAKERSEQRAKRRRKKSEAPA